MGVMFDLHHHGHNDVTTVAIGFPWPRLSPAHSDMHGPHARQHPARRNLIDPRWTPATSVFTKKESAVLGTDNEHFFRTGLKFESIWKYIVECNYFLNGFRGKCAESILKCPRWKTNDFKLQNKELNKMTKHGNHLFLYTQICCQSCHRHAEDISQDLPGYQKKRNQ